jgi:hypothetical protein
MNAAAFAAGILVAFVSTAPSQKSRSRAYIPDRCSQFLDLQPLHSPANKTGADEFIVGACVRPTQKNQGCS